MENTYGTNACKSNKANPSIECTVKECAHHCENQNYCSLSMIRVVTHEQNPTEVACTDCSSFKKKNG